MITPQATKFNILLLLAFLFLIIIVPLYLSIVASISWVYNESSFSNGLSVFNNYAFKPIEGASTYLSLLNYFFETKQYGLQILAVPLSSALLSARTLFLLRAPLMDFRPFKKPERTHAEEDIKKTEYKIINDDNTVSVNKLVDSVFSAEQSIQHRDDALSAIRAVLGTHLPGGVSYHNIGLLKIYLSAAIEAAYPNTPNQFLVFMTEVTKPDNLLDINNPLILYHILINGHKNSTEIL